MTHPAKDLLIAIAEGKQMECLIHPHWVFCEPTKALSWIANGFLTSVRIARPMVERTVRYPEPLRDFPEGGKIAWCVSPEYPVAQAITSRGLMRLFIDHGMAFATEADAAEAHKSLYGGGNE